MNTQGTGRGGSGVECGLCQSESLVGDDGIGCDQCSNWYHPTQQCTGLTKTSIQAIKRDGGNAIRFVCSKCRCEGPSGGNSNAEMRESIAQLYQTVTALAASVTDLTRQLASLTLAGNTTSVPPPYPAGQAFDRDSCMPSYESMKSVRNAPRH